MAVDPPADDPRAVALGRETERLARRVANLEQLVRVLAESIADRGGPAAEDSPAAGPLSWLLVDDPAAASAALTDLTMWLEAVYLRYADAALPSCWLWHPDVVEELLAAREAHRDAYEAAGRSAQRASDWHDRVRPAVVKRIRASAADCELALHVHGGDRRRPPPPVPGAAASARIADAWVTARTQPEPTDAQLSEAAQHDRAQHARNSR